MNERLYKKSLSTLNHIFLDFSLKNKHNRQIRDVFKRLISRQSFHGLAKLTTCNFFFAIKMVRNFIDRLVIEALVIEALFSEQE